MDRLVLIHFLAWRGNPPRPVKDSAPKGVIVDDLVFVDEVHAPEEYKKAWRDIVEGRAKESNP